MSTNLLASLEQLRAVDPQALTHHRHIGLERESLRVSADGHIASTPHPPTLGSALAHPYITTDYSEALLEFVTPPVVRPAEALQFLTTVHQFVSRHLPSEEFLWSASMPCVVGGEASIPIAYYGDSNLGKSRHVYRRGLGYRYGKTMQIIAGVHFNFSLDQAFWQSYQTVLEDQSPLQDFSSARYMGLIRNLQRLGWLVIYLFGASPAVCKSFLREQGPGDLAEFDANTYYAPYATSLRMSNIGYTNKNARKAKTGLCISYDSLEEYTASLSRAIHTPYDDYERIGIRVDGEYRQLNTNVLQIENEYYSTVRPKQPLKPGERPTQALRRRGIGYVELRSVDIGVADPLGLNENQLRFLEAFMLLGVLLDSPSVSDSERQEIDHNQLIAAIAGRAPGVLLQRGGQPVSLQQWAMELCDAMAPLCRWMDEGEAGEPYSHALEVQRRAVQNPALTPSARMLAEMRDRGEGFFHYARHKSEEFQQYFRCLPLDGEQIQRFEEWARSSWEEQRQLESQDTLDFDDYLQRYLAD